MTGTASTGHQREHERIRAAYRFYDSSAGEQRKRDEANPGVRRNTDIRWAVLNRVLSELVLPPGPRLLDVGCGAGEDLRRIAVEFAGLRPSLHGVDLLPDRIARAREAVPGGTFQVGGAEHLPYDDGHFDVVIAATVFSSMLDDELARAVACEMRRVTSKTGVILCYDTRYPNPWNQHTRAMNRRRLQRLFCGARIRLCSLTLLPPLARRLGGLVELAYPPLHTVPWLRSHYLALIFPSAGRGED